VEDGETRLRWHAKRQVAKITTRTSVGRFPKRTPKASYRRSGGTQTVLRREADTIDDDYCWTARLAFNERR
jgi:hypothetical protein